MITNKNIPWDIMAKFLKIRNYKNPTRIPGALRKIIPEALTSQGNKNDN